MSTSSESRLSFRLPADQKATIEEAATCLGRSVTDFAVSTLVESAREVIRDHQVTLLTDRDRDLFIRLLDDPHAKPNAALAAAAARYKEEFQ